MGHQIESKLPPERPERTLAAGAHILGIFSPVIGPLIVWVASGRSSRFIASHAKQIFWQNIILGAIFFTFTAVSLIWNVSRAIGMSWEEFLKQDWLAIATRMAIVWIAMAIIGLIQSLLAIRGAIRAYGGHWPGRS